MPLPLSAVQSDSSCENVLGGALIPALASRDLL